MTFVKTNAPEKRTNWCFQADADVKKNGFYFVAIFRMAKWQKISVSMLLKAEVRAAAELFSDNFLGVKRR